MSSHALVGQNRSPPARRWAFAATLFMATIGLAPADAQAKLPEIRTSASNRVPACVTPGRLMRFMTQRNRMLDPRWRDIADHYKRHGETWRVRWDYAFFQMLVETNYLTYRTGTGRSGDVKPAQNNFAGIGTTGGGVPGDSYPDASTGVLAQIQHLVAYSGERLSSPVGPRTREKQDDIIQKSRSLGRAVTFQDLSGRWAVDRRYGQTMAFTASRYFSQFCDGRGSPDVADTSAPPPPPPVPRPAPEMASGGGSVQHAYLTATRGGPSHSPTVAPAAAAAAEPSPSGAEIARRTVAEERKSGRRRSGVGARKRTEPIAEPTVERGAPGLAGSSCRIFTASYGGERNVLIRTVVGAETHYTALQVLAGQELALATAYIEDHSPGGMSIGEFATRRDALVKAMELCPTTAKQAAR